MTDLNSIASTVGLRDAAERVSRLRSEKEAQNLFSSAVNNGDDQLRDTLIDLAANKGWNLSPKVEAGAESIKARALLVELLNLALSAPQAITESQKFTNPDLNPPALTAARLERFNTTNADLQKRTAAIVAQTDALATKTSAQAQAVWPVLDPTDTAQLARTAQAWQFNILPNLTPGTWPIWSTIVDNLDVDGLIALERFAPTWIRNSTNDHNEAAAKINQVNQGIQTRMPHAVTDPTTKAVIQNSIATIDFAHRAASIAAAIGTINRPGGPLTSLSVAARITAADIGALGEVTPHPRLNRVR
jgi:hypothetical protein